MLECLGVLRTLFFETFGLITISIQFLGNIGVVSMIFSGLLRRIQERAWMVGFLLEKGDLTNLFAFLAL